MQVLIDCSYSSIVSSSGYSNPKKFFSSDPCSYSPLTLHITRPMFSVSSIAAFVSCFFFVTCPSTSPEAGRLQLRFPVHCSHWVPAQKCKWSSRFYTLHCRWCHGYELLLVPSPSVLLQTFLCKRDNGTCYGRFALKLFLVCLCYPGNIKNIQTLLRDYLFPKPMMQSTGL